MLRVFLIKTPVSYTHLDVYKRQVYALAQQVDADEDGEDAQTQVAQQLRSLKGVKLGMYIACLLYTSRCV